MGMGTSGDDRGPVSEINITPLVDVMLVLLVIFMVTAPMMESGIAIRLPRASAKALPKEENPVTLTITKEQRFYLNKDEVPADKLKPALQSFFKRRAKREVFIRADGELLYSVVAQAMATVKLAGVDKIGLVTLPPENSK